MRHGFASAAFVRSRPFCAAAIALLAVVATADDARAVVKGTSSSLERHTVRVIRGGIRCSGVAIAQRLVATARHCGTGTVIAGGLRIGAVARVTGATLDDGRPVRVVGDAAILKLAAPLPASVTPAPVGDGDGETYVIAGYGTADERNRGAYGQLREAQLVAAEPNALVDPNRTGSIGASACFGDSGGPVLRGGTLVGIVTRAAHPHPRIACGHLTRYTPIIVGAAALADAAPADAPRKIRRKKTIAVAPVWRPFWRTTSAHGS